MKYKHQHRTDRTFAGKEEIYLIYRLKIGFFLAKYTIVTTIITANREKTGEKQQDAYRVHETPN